MALFFRAAPISDNIEGEIPPLDGRNQVHTNA